MKVRSKLLCLLLASSTVNAFTSLKSSKGYIGALPTSASSRLYSCRNEDSFQTFNKMKDGMFAAATIFSTALITDLATIDVHQSPANAADLQLSKGAFVIQTSSKPGQSLIKTEIDSQSLLKSLFQNRKELGASIGRIQGAIQQELNGPAWLDIQKEIIDIEGDVLPSVTLTPPADLAQTVKDVSKGRLNFLVNGEIVNIAVEPTFGEEEDDLVVRITGFKGEKLTGLISEQSLFKPAYGPIRTWLGQFEEFWAFWDDAYPEKYLPKGAHLSNGQVILTGTAATIGGIYLLSYSYYTQQLEEEAAAAKAKKIALAEKAKSKKLKPGKQEAKQKKTDINTEENKEEEKKATSNDVTKVDKIEKTDEQVVTKKKRRMRFRFWKKN